MSTTARSRYGVAGILLPAVMLLTACATGNVGKKPDPTPAQLAEQLNYSLVEELQAINNYRFDGWYYLNHKAITLDGPPGTRYLVTLRDRCHELQSTEVIGTSSTNNRLTGFDKLIVSTAGGGTRNCLIDKLYRLEKIR